MRNERLKEVIREEAAETITQGLADPRIGFCTVTHISLTDDLSYCTVHVSVLGDRAVKSRTMHALQDARGLLQSRIARRMRTRTTPHVEVELDESIERSFVLLDKIKQARASDPDGGKSSPDSVPAGPEDLEAEPDETGGS